jgi:methylglutaconyl-CoA hydratase
MITPSTHDSVAMRFEQISENCPSRLAILSLNRPETANAFDARMIESITSCVERVGMEKDIRAFILCSRGKNFSAGADLTWMKASAGLGMNENFKDANKLMAMFEALSKLPIPTISIAQGAAFGGGVGLIACCDIAIAYETAKFCLSEVRLGILPAVIYPYLARKIIPGQLARLSLTARVFSGIEAKNIGLAQINCTAETITETLRGELNHLLAAGPSAIARLKILQQRVRQEGNSQGEYTARSISSARVEPEAQSGFEAFFQKSAPPWLLELDEDWTFDA